MPESLIFCSNELLLSPFKLELFSEKNIVLQKELPKRIRFLSNWGGAVGFPAPKSPTLMGCSVKNIPD